MMNYYRGFGHMYGGMGSSFICVLIGLVIFVDLVLLGMWLWVRIKKDEKCCAKNSEHNHDHNHDHNHPHPHSH